MANLALSMATPLEFNDFLAMFQDITRRISRVDDS
jgi:hypothetical protein